MNDKHSSTSFIEKMDNGKFQMVNDPRSNFYKEENIKNNLKLDIDFSNCLNDAVSAKKDPVVNSETKFKQKGPFICGTCGKIYQYKSHFIIHCRIHTKYKPFICSICNKGFYCQAQLNKHLCVHSNERPYVCEICMCAFKTRSVFKYHSKCHTGEKNYKCNICEKRYQSRNALYTHNKHIHSDLKPYVCEICHMSFKIKGLLSSHALTHITEKQFKCEFCHKCFKSKTLRKIHFRKHTGEKPYVCDFCEKSFYNVTSFKKHSVTHSNQQEKEQGKKETVIKQICTKYNKNVHRTFINKHLEKCKVDSRMTDPVEQPVHKCAVCNKEFKTKFLLKTHTKRHLNPKSRRYVYSVHENINLT